MCELVSRFAALRVRPGHRDYDRRESPGRSSHDRTSAVL